METSQSAQMVLGAFVADAASLGVHWIYDPARLTQIADRQDGRTAFTPINPDNYADVPAYFAHGARQDGDLTQYGEVLRLILRSLRVNQGFDGAAYRAEFAAHFGPGGAYRGYIDRPTRGALEAIANESKITGIDDDQLPAVATLPAILAVFHGHPELTETLQAAREVTNINPVADQYADAFTDLLGLQLDGVELREALETAASRASDPIQAALQAALSTDEADTIAYGEVTGRACHLPMAGPLTWHLLARATSFRDGVERNNRAGGDSAGRSLTVGAALALEFGLTGETGLPLDWILALREGADLWSECQAAAGPTFPTAAFPRR